MTLEMLTLDSWIMSDNHWQHANIRKYGQRPDNHFELMRENWLRLVQPDDVILHLGDIVCYGNNQLHSDWLKGLTGKKYLLRGNHDRHPDSWYEEHGFTVLGTKPLFWHRPDNGEKICFSHVPADAASGESMDWTINVHGHIHINPYHFNTVRVEDRRNVCVEKTDYAPVRLREIL